MGYHAGGVSVGKILKDSIHICQLIQSKINILRALAIAKAFSYIIREDNTGCC